MRDEWSQQDGTGTESTDKYKNVSEPDFRNSDGTPNTQKNAAAKKAKEAYDKALAEAKSSKMTKMQLKKLLIMQKLS